jgi:serine phosphatase RsbU (regulator of sigma subunit)
MRALALSILFSMASVLSLSGQEQALDIRGLDAYLRPGFSLEWVFNVPLPGDSDWIRLPKERGFTELAMRSLAREAGVEPDGEDVRRFCLVMPFTISDSLYNASGGLGIYLDSIGQNWQVYLNGYLVRDETYFARDGSIRAERSIKGALFQIDARWLKRGNNVLAFMVAGDPGLSDAGLWSNGVYRIDSYERLLSLKGESPRLMLIGIYAFFGLYHAILFALRPKTRAYLFYSVATLILSAFLFARTFIVHELILDTRLTKGVETAAMFLILPSFMGFFDAVLGRKRSLFSQLYALACIAAAAAQFFVARELIVLVWKLSIALPIAFIVYTDIFVPIRKAVRHYLRLQNSRSRLKALFRGLARTDATKLLAGSLIVAVALLLDALGLSPGGTMSFLEVGFLLLVLGTAAVLASEFIKVYRDAERFKQHLEERVAARSRELETTLVEEESLSVRLSEASSRLHAVSSVAQKDLRIATQVQQGFFPKSAPHTAAWDTAFVYMPAGGISGDFYDFYLRGDRLEGLVVGDVSGHGIASGLITVLARSLFHRNFYERRQRSLGAVLESINEELIPELSEVENYLTAAFLRLEDDGRVEYASAAHPELAFKGAEKLRAMLLRPKGGAEYKGPPLGREGIEAPYSSIRFSLKPGDALLIYTDGLNESKNVDGEEFGLDGVLESLSSAPEGDASAVLDYIMQEWRFFVSGAKVSDDITVVLLKKT